MGRFAIGILTLIAEFELERIKERSPDCRAQPWNHERQMSARTLP